MPSELANPTEMTQGSVEWRLQRAGMVTASRFKDILTQPRSKADRQAGIMSKTAQAYLNECIAESILQKPLDGFRSDATDWGKEWEAEAFQRSLPMIQDMFGVRPRVPEGDECFFEHPAEELIGCSPDGMISAQGLVEIKCCYNVTKHLDMVRHGWHYEDHKAQVQGSLWITGRTKYACVSFDDRYTNTIVPPCVAITVERDDEYIDGVLAPAVCRFRDRLKEELDIIRTDFREREQIPF